MAMEILLMAKLITLQESNKMKHTVIKLLLILVMSSLVMAGQMSINGSETTQINSTLAQLYDKSPTVVNHLESTGEGVAFGKWETDVYQYIYKIVVKNNDTVRVGVFVMTKINKPNEPFVKNNNLKVGTVLLIDGTAQNKLVYIGKLDGDISVSPTTANLGEKTIFTVTGSNLPSTLTMWIPYCDKMTPLGGNSTSKKFYCTPNWGHAGIQKSVIKDKPKGKILKNFSVDVKSNSFPDTEIKTRSNSSKYAKTDNAFYMSDRSLAGQCTWYAYARVMELADKGYFSSDVRDRIRNALWGKTGRDGGKWENFIGGSWIGTSKVALPMEKRVAGLLVVWTTNSAGHVGFVEEISADKKSYRLSDFNRGLNTSYRSAWYDFDISDKLGVWPKFYNLNNHSNF